MNWAGGQYKQILRVVFIAIFQEEPGSGW